MIVQSQIIYSIESPSASSRAASRVSSNVRTVSDSLLISAAPRGGITAPGIHRRRRDASSGIREYSRRLPDSPGDWRAEVRIGSFPDRQRDMQSLRTMRPSVRRRLRRNGERWLSEAKR